MPGSKSESNRLLILKHLYFPDLEIQNLSDSRDTDLMLRNLKERGNFYNVGDAGTVMRFITACLAVKPHQEFVVQGSERMHQRPVGILVDALRTLGADIEYLGKEAYPPLKIHGKKLAGGEISMDASVSSQFITALMLIAPGFEHGLRINLKGLSVSAPYIYLTANLMRRLGFKLRVNGDAVEVDPFVPEAPAGFAVEPDWSAASYWFLISLLAEKSEIYLPGFRQYSLQGDAFVSGLFEPLGVESYFIGSGFRLHKTKLAQQQFSINLIHNPDLAQTMAVAFAAKNIPAKITGLQTLRIKETDRLEALKKELEKTGARLETGEDYLEVKEGIQNLKAVSFETYDDHRMAMALSPLALLGDIEIRNPGVVVKSYQSFWHDLEKVGFQIH